MTDAVARVCPPRQVPASVSCFQRGMGWKVNGCNTAQGTAAASRNPANSSSLRAVGDVEPAHPGTLKLRHREAVSRMFESNDQVWDAEKALALARGLYD